MQHNIFNFKPLRLPTVERHCPKCGTATTFINTEKFRVNANKKNLDIWMILQCHRCRATFNLALHERIHPAKLSQETLEAYMANCPEKIAEVAFNPIAYQRSGVAPILRAEDWCYTRAEDGCFSRATVANGQDKDQVANLAAGSALTSGHFAIQVSYPRLLRADWVLQQVTGLSRSQLKRLWQCGRLTTEDGGIKGPEAFFVHSITNFNLMHL